MQVTSLALKELVSSIISDNSSGNNSVGGDGSGFGAVLKTGMPNDKLKEAIQDILTSKLSSKESSKQIKELLLKGSVVEGSNPKDILGALAELAKSSDLNGKIDISSLLEDFMKEMSTKIKSAVEKLQKSNHPHKEELIQGLEKLNQELTELVQDVFASTIIPIDLTAQDFAEVQRLLSKLPEEKNIPAQDLNKLRQILTSLKEAPTKENLQELKTIVEALPQTETTEKLKKIFDKQETKDLISSIHSAVKDFTETPSLENLVKLNLLLEKVDTTTGNAALKDLKNFVKKEISALPPEVKPLIAAMKENLDAKKEPLEGAKALTRKEDAEPIPQVLREDITPIQIKETVEPIPQTLTALKEIIKKEDLNPIQIKETVGAENLAKNVKESPVVANVPPENKVIDLITSQQALLVSDPKGKILSNPELVQKETATAEKSLIAVKNTAEQLLQKASPEVVQAVKNLAKDLFKTEVATQEKANAIEGKLNAQLNKLDALLKKATNGADVSSLNLDSLKAEIKSLKDTVGIPERPSIVSDIKLNQSKIPTSEQLIKDSLFTKKAATENPIEAMLKLPVETTTSHTGNTSSPISATMPASNTSFSYTLKTPEGDAASVMNQVTEKIRASFNKSQLTIALNPTNLGNVNVSISLHKGAIIATMSTENIKAFDALKDGVNNLKQTLIESGLTVDKVVVTPPEKGGFSAGQEFTHHNKGSFEEQFNQSKQNNNAFQAQGDTSGDGQKGSEHKNSQETTGNGHGTTGVNVEMSGEAINAEMQNDNNILDIEKGIVDYSV